MATSKKTRGLPARSRRATTASDAARSAASTAAPSASVKAAPLVHGTAGPRARTRGASPSRSRSYRLPQHAPPGWPPQPPGAPQKTHSTQPRPAWPAASSLARCARHDSQHAAGDGRMFASPHISTLPSYSVCGAV